MASNFAQSNRSQQTVSCWTETANTDSGDFGLTRGVAKSGGRKAETLAQHPSKVCSGKSRQSINAFRERGVSCCRSTRHLCDRQSVMTTAHGSRVHRDRPYAKCKVRGMPSFPAFRHRGNAPDPGSFERTSSSSGPRIRRACHPRNWSELPSRRRLGGQPWR